MKFIGVFFTVLLAFYLAVGADSASVSLSSNQLTLSGNARIQFYGPVEDVWAGLSHGHRFPVINSGDIIALRMAYTSGSMASWWLLCSSSSCTYNTCGGTTMTSAKWSSCSSKMMFKITAMGKTDGQTINSGDTVTLGSKYHGYTYRLRCLKSGHKCATDWSISSLKGNNWLYYTEATFRIFSKNAVDGTPVQFADVVGFKYSDPGPSYWLSYYNSNFYARGCSKYYKASCAKENAYTGFQIFKQL